MTQAPVSHTPASWLQYIAQLRKDFPPALLAERCWLRWKRIPRGSRVAKVPFPTYDRRGQYLTFQEASRFPGLGFAGLGVANVGLPFTILDVDAKDPLQLALGGGAPADEYQPWWRVDRTTNRPTFFTSINTYWERSPSGRGLRGFLLGRLPEHGPGIRIVDGVEVYRDKWATVTGTWVNPVRELPPLPSWLTRAWDVVMPTPTPASSAPCVTADDPGPWDVGMLRERLEAWRRFIPGFQFAQYGDETKPPFRAEFAVTCPGDTAGWPDGNHHTELDGTIFTDLTSRYGGRCYQRSPAAPTRVKIINGLPCFHCFHTHCFGKRWLDFQNFYDPLRLFHTVEESLENWIERVQNTPLDPDSPYGKVGG